MPEVFVEYNVSCAMSVGFDIMKRFLQSTFLSYGAPDEPFARRLYEALQRRDILFWRARRPVPEAASPKLFHRFSAQREDILEFVGMPF